MIKLLKDIVEIGSGYTFRERLDAYPDGDIAVVQMKNLGPDDCIKSADLPRVALADLGEKQLLKQGDILLRARGHFHTAAVVTESLGPAVAAAPLMLMRASPLKVLPEYLRWFINHPRTQAILVNLAVGTHVRTLNIAAIANLEIALPSLEQQHRIAAIAELGQKEKALLHQIAEQRGMLLDEILARHARNTR